MCPSCFPEASSPAICCSPLMTTVHAMHKVCNLGQSWIDLGPNSLDCKGGDSIQSRDHQPEVTKIHTERHQKALAKFGEYEDEKIAFSCLLQAGQRNFFTSRSPNLAEAF